MDLQGALARPSAAEGRDRISAHRDPIRFSVEVAALGLTARAALLRGRRLIAALGRVQPYGRSARCSGSRPLEAR
jgi:hypothetical protein